MHCITRSITDVTANSHPCTRVPGVSHRQIHAIPTVTVTTGNPLHNTRRWQANSESQAVHSVRTVTQPERRAGRFRLRVRLDMIERHVGLQFRSSYPGTRVPG
eukprot:2914617-Rhodomonas_salina.1